MTATGARAHALSIMQEVGRGRRLDVVWESVAPSVAPEDRPWVHEVVFGAARMRGRIDHLLGLHLHRGLASVPLPLLQVLRLGAYQLLGMGSVPDYAAVSQSVDQAKAIGGRKAAGLVNAVLRGLAAAGASRERFPAFEDDPIGHLSTWGSHPRWMVARWVHRLGVDGARQVTEAGNRIPRLHIRPVGVTLDAALRRLEADGIEAEPGPTGSGTLRLPRGVDPGEVLRIVPAVVQDPAAATVVGFVGATRDDRVADLCAAPGGKGVAIAGDGAWVVGADPSAGRLQRMRESLRRLGLPERLVVARGEHPPFQGFDRVLVDAPCTGTGTLARHPDLRWRLEPEAPERMSAVQSAILAGAARALRPGGLLVYATCTLEPEENEEVIARFLDGHTEFSPDGEGGEAVLRILPRSHETDGAFAARLRRIS